MCFVWCPAEGERRDFVIEALFPNAPRTCAHIVKPFGLGETLHIPCQSNTLGRKIRIRMLAARPLILAEVQVFGEKGRFIYTSFILKTTSLLQLVICQVKYILSNTTKMENQPSDSPLSNNKCNYFI